MKNLFILIFTLLFIQITVYSQPCLPQGITFTTQEQIDNFQINYPSCTEIEGDVTISGDDITNLNGMNVLTSIGGDLEIRYNSALTSLVGLDNVTLVGEDLFIGSYDIHAQPGGLVCEGNQILADLTALSNLTNIGGDLRVCCNDALTNLSGLENLSTIGGSLRIGYAHEDYIVQLAGNQSLTNITGLQGVSAIGGNVDIQGNILLTSLAGLENIDASSIENLTIRHNNSLSVCEMQSICDYLSNPEGVVEVYSNATGCNDPAEIANACGFTMNCLPYGNYHFNSQSAIDSFQYWYPGCTELEGNVFISGGDITNLGGLSVVTSIAETLFIRDNDSLTNLTGLNNLEFVLGDLKIGDIWGESNIALNSMTGLENLILIGGTLQVQGNNVLTSLAGLDNIIAGSINNLKIKHNHTLSICEVQSICDYLAAPNGNTSIYNNAPGCNSQEEVEEACGLSVNESSIINNLSIYPNPFSNTVAVEFELSQPESVTLTFYNHLGKQIEVIEENQSQGKQQIIWSSEELPAGVYFCVLKTESGMQTMKMIKLK